MSTFPTLSRPPSYPINETYVDDVLRSPTEAGYEITRPRFTKRRKIFTVRYNTLPNADKVLIDNFYRNTVKGAAHFTWTHPFTNQTYTVVFTKPPTFELTFLDYWNVEFELREV